MRENKGNVLNVNANGAEVSNIKQRVEIYNYDRDFDDILFQVTFELKNIISSAWSSCLSDLDSFLLEEIIAEIQEKLSLDKDMLISFVRQMKADYPYLRDEERVNSVIIFLINIALCGGNYSFIKSDNFYKLLVSFGKKEYEFSIYNLNFANKRLLSMVGADVIKFLIRKRYIPAIFDEILLCGTEFSCNKECLKDEAILGIIIDDFTEVDKYEKKAPDFFTGLSKDPVINCGNCLADSIYDYQKAAEIIKVRFLDD